MGFIEISGVCKSFGSGSETRRVLTDATLSIDRGEITFHGSAKEALADEGVMRTLRG